MRLAQLLGPDLKAALANDPEELRDALEEFHAEDIAELIDELPEQESLALMRALPDDYAAQVLERLGDDVRTAIIERIGPEEAANLITEMRPDDRADTMQDLPNEVAEQILAKLDEKEPAVAEEVRELVAYPEDSAGGLMTTAFVSLPPDMKVWQGIDEVRRLSREVETVAYVYVVAFGEKLVGVCSLRELILAEPGAALSDVMTENVLRVLPNADQEEVAKTIAKYNLSAIPVVNEHGHMLGVVTVDDVVDVVMEEATEDAQKMAGVQPFAEGYFATRVLTLVRKRATWLIALFLGGLFTANVIQHYQGELHKHTELELFMALILSAGGNSGSQSCSLIIGALSSGEAKPTDWLRVLFREIAVGSLLGLTLGVVGFLRSFLIGPTSFTALVPITVACAVLSVVTVGSIVGSLMPLLMKRLGLDPAVSSTPFIASLLDVLGLFIYFSVAALLIEALA